MIRTAILLATAFACLACALPASADTPNKVNLRPPVHLPPAASGKSPTAPGNPLEGKLLRYLIGTDNPGAGSQDKVIEVSYSVERPPPKGLAIAYCNLFDEENTGKYGPYLHTSDTAEQYAEGQIDAKGPGWETNLREQFQRRKRQGFTYIELDNPDAYTVDDVLGAINLAAAYGLKVIAKNPGLMQGDATSYVAHSNVFGIIVEKDAGTPEQMDELRKKAGKPTLPVWFVAFGDGQSWANEIATMAGYQKNMSVTYSSRGEYENAIDVRAAPLKQETSVRPAGIAVAAKSPSG